MDNWRGDLHLHQILIGLCTPSLVREEHHGGSIFIAPSHPRGGDQAFLPTPRGRRLPPSHQGGGAVHEVGTRMHRRVPLHMFLRITPHSSAPPPARVERTMCRRSRQHAFGGKHRARRRLPGRCSISHIHRRRSRSTTNASATLSSGLV
jgi:hypothetical protein